ncbi:MAG: hypothetical protein KGL39_09930 [Patescibacteria group bacterium]|nr:hypothetical protein [Patescibacteria group bacterium]
MKQRIVWTTREQNAVVESVITHPQYGFWPTWKVVREIQARMLPPERQRALRKKEDIQALVPIIDTRLRLKKTVETPLALAKVEEQPIPFLPNESVKPVDPIERLSGALEFYIEQIVEKRLEALIERLTDRLGKDTSTKPEEKVKHSRILIGGLLPGQVNMIRQEFGNRFDLRFWLATESTDRLRAGAGHADRVYLMTDFINHSQEETIKRKDNYERISGGMTALREKLALLTKEIAK